MILESIMLHNFGQYRGRHEIPLEPEDPAKPIILFGGLNGAGKTTLLDGIHLSLYGIRAQCSTREGLNYPEFLRQSINRSVPEEEGASISLAFRHRTEGQEHQYRVTRSWRSTGKTVPERVEVLHNGEHDSVLSDGWDEHVEQFLPQRLAQLFFFDGEKIKDLANIENSASILESAMRSLLGLDLVDQLSTDLKVLEQRKKVEMRSDESRIQFQQLEDQVEELEVRRSDLNAKNSKLKGKLYSAEKELTEVNRSFQREGGDLYNRRNELRQAQKKTAERLAAAKDQLRDIASGSAPLLLVTSQLEAALETSQAERASDEASLLVRHLEGQLVRISELLSRLNLADSDEQQLRGLLDDDLEELRSRARAGGVLGLNSETRHQLNALLSTLLPAERSRLDQRVRAADLLSAALADADRKIAAVPEDDAIAELVEMRKVAEREVDDLRFRMRVVSEELQSLESQRKTLSSRLQSELNRTTEARFRAEGDERILRHSNKARAILERFRVAVLERHLSRIESLVLESYQSLLRKQSLVAKIAIDPCTTQLKLEGDDGKEVDPQRLSAGERQLLAVSLLWGLARASGRPLPTVVDTPMGRLDSKHRNHLIHRYFPRASHQVLLLSTDEEIHEGYYKDLRKWVGRSYHLRYDEDSRSTQVEQGYFW